MNSDQTVLRLIVARVLSGLLGSSDEAIRAAVRDSWMVGDRIGATLAGRPAGHVQLRKGTVRATVTDPAAFEAWADSRGEVEHIKTTRVRPAYQSAVLAAAKKAGAAVTAEGEEIPGITVAVGDPTVAVLLADGAERLVAEAWQTGELWELIGGLLPALERADQPPESS